LLGSQDREDKNQSQITTLAELITLERQFSPKPAHQTGHEAQKATP
jgi:hypothetical protein